MKKNFLSVAGLFLTGLLITSCSEGIEKKIDVKMGTDCVIISVPKDSAANYINIYRGKVEPVTDEGGTPVVDDDGNLQYKDPESYSKIGQINSSSKDGMISYIFSDYLAVKDDVYKYSVRYIYNTRTVSNGWSKEIVCTSGLAADPILDITTNDATFVYDPRTYNITVNNACVAPALAGIPSKAEWKLSIAVQSQVKSRVFNIKNGDGADPDPAPVGFADGDVIDLRTVLSSDFFNTQIKILGYLFEYTESAVAGPYTMYHWTEIAAPENPDGGTPHFLQYVKDESGEYKAVPEAVSEAVIFINYDYSDDNHHDFGDRSLSIKNFEAEKDYSDLIIE